MDQGERGHSRGGAAPAEESSPRRLTRESRGLGNAPAPFPESYHRSRTLSPLRRVFRARTRLFARDLANKRPTTLQASHQNTYLN